MQLAPRFAYQRDQPPLYREMNVFIGDIETELTALNFVFDSLESNDDRAQLGRLQQPDLRQHLRMRDRSANIVPEQPPVERQRRRERLNLGDSPARKPPTDQIARCALLLAA